MNNPVIEGPEILSLGISVLVIVGIVILLGWLYSRLRFNGGPGGNTINVVATRGLGPKERLLLVEEGDKQLLAGLTAASVQTLHTFDRPVVTEEPIREEQGFAERLRTAVKGATR